MIKLTSPMSRPSSATLVATKVLSFPDLNAFTVAAYTFCVISSCYPKKYSDLTRGHLLSKNAFISLAESLYCVKTITFDLSACIGSEKKIVSRSASFLNLGWFDVFIVSSIYPVRSLYSLLVFTYFKKPSFFSSFLAKSNMRSK